MIVGSWRAFAVVAALSVHASAATLSSSIPTQLAPLADGLALSIGRALPVTAASAGFGYVFDPATNVFERQTPILGQLFIEKADTIGAGRWQLAAGWQRVAFDTYEGRDLDDAGLGRSRFPGPPLPTVVRYGGISMDLSVDEVIASVTWGPREDLEVNLALPVLSSDFRLDSGPVRLAKEFGGGVVLPASRVRASAVGPGDLLLRGKWRLLRGRTGRLAAGLVLQFPTGSREDFQGTGEFEFTPALYASTAELRLWKIALEGHLNLGFRIAATDAQQSEGRWGVGFDLRPLDLVTFGIGVLGRHPIEAVGPGGGCNIPTSTTLEPGDCFFPAPFTFPSRESGPPISAVGLSTERPDYYDASFGVRVRLWRGLLAFANVLLPLNRDGFRADTVPFAGLEASF